jgi:soluble lytic murein transglycosylase-like protein
MKTLSLSILTILAAAAPAHAQVIEISASGEAMTFDGPTLFTDAAPTPINPPKRASATERRAAADPVNLLADAARSHGIDPALLQAVAWQESRGRMSAISPKGALGVMQLMPGTAAELGVDPRDVVGNVYGGARYLRRQLDRFGGSVPLALAAYNAGPGAVTRFGGIPPYRETRDYVTRIMGRWRPAAPTLVAVPPAPPSPPVVTTFIEVPAL